MNVKVLEKNKDKVALELEGEDETFPKLLQSKLLEDKSVDVAYAAKDHPLVGDPQVIVTGKNALGSVKKAAKSVSTELSDLKKKVKRL